MSWLLGYLTSSIGKKQVMAVTGLLLCIFLITHLAGNFLIFMGPEAFNSYSHSLLSNPLILFAELGLFLLFFVHIIFALRVSIENQDARPVKYYFKTTTGRGATFFSTTMPYTGLIILIFLILHVLKFRFGQAPDVTYNNIIMRDIHHLLVQTFSDPAYVVWYVFAQVALGFHLVHGVPSAFATLGFSHPKYKTPLKVLGILFALAMSIGYASIPIWVYLQQGGRS